MPSLDIKVLPKPRFDYLHRLLVAGVVVAISGSLIFTLVGTVGLVMAFLAIVIRLSLTPDLILKYHPSFRRTRALSRVVAKEAFDALDQLVAKAGLAEAPKLLISDRADLDAQTISTPFGAVIVVTRDMLERFSNAELAGVLAHEIGHIKNRDGYIAWGLNTAALLALIFVVTGALLGWTRFEGLNALALEEGQAIVVVMTVISALAMLLNVVVLRALENDADMTAIAMTGNPAALASALAKHPTENQGSYAYWLDGHPPTCKRIARLQAIAGVTGFSE
ncbi:M48 family metalloprotease [Pelagibius sp. Alg239-R121]|uniref:M48 family metalloprotease n=1 Tax=Pelagibius sp. Alg239-R121 TaxID=2993448 RepID=UPI0024A6600A|nr:M48 family metalloprotease [Pelagibius sp. Alg239-R121]